MSLWTCIACAARRAVGLDTCPQCGAAAHEEGDTVSGAEGVQGQPHVPPAYADAAPTAPTAAPATAEALPQAATETAVADAVVAPVDEPPAPEANA